MRFHIRIILIALVGMIYGSTMAQEGLKLELIPKKETKLYEELYLEAWLYNNGSSDLKIFKIGFSEPAWNGYQYDWKMQYNGEDVQIRKFRDGASGRFRESHILTISPGSKVYAGLIRRKIDKAGKYSFVYNLSADPESVSLNFAANPISRQLATQITKFQISASFEVEVEGLDFNKINVKRTDITVEELKKKPNYGLVDAFENPSEVYKLRIHKTVSAEELNNIYKFQNIRELTINNLENIEKLPANLSSLDLRYLTLTKLSVEEYPAEYANWDNLNVLIFSSLEGKFPEFVYGLENLEKLSINYKNLDEIPDGIENLKKLKSITISGNRKDLKLTQGFSKLPALEQLSITAANVNQFPPVWESKGLTRIVLNYTGIPEIPNEIENLANLTYLSMNNNKLSGLPAEFNKLEKLEHFSASNNLFVEVPRVLYDCSLLKYMGFNSNRITVIPEGIHALKKLGNLQLSGNQITEFPKGISECTSLRTVNIRGNDVKGKEKSILKKRLGRKNFFE